MIAEQRVFLQLGIVKCFLGEHHKCVPDNYYNLLQFISFNPDDDWFPNALIDNVKLRKIFLCVG